MDVLMDVIRVALKAAAWVNRQAARWVEPLGDDSEYALAVSMVYIVAANLAFCLVVLMVAWSAMMMV